MTQKQYSCLLIVLILFCWAADLTIPLEAGGARAKPAGVSANCRLEMATGLPSWITTGAEVAGRFLVVDVVKRKLIQISGDGVAGELQTAIGDFVSGQNITRIRPSVSLGEPAPPIVLEFADGSLRKVERSLIPSRKVEKVVTQGLKSQNLEGKKREIGRLHDWILTGNGQEVFGYADLAIGAISEDPPPADWRNGFVRFNLGRDQKSFRIFEESLYPGNMRNMMMLTYSLMASIGNSVYVVYQDGNFLELRRLAPGSQTLQLMRAFPKHLRGELAPVLPSFVTPEEYVYTMEIAEMSTMPVGLYSWDDALFLLSRSHKHGQRHWYLSKIDPVVDEVLWEVRLPGASPHMMAIPGEKEWAFLEKGSVLARHNQITQQIRFVNSEHLRARSMSSKSLCN